MHPDLVFLWRCIQLRDLTERPISQIEVLDLAGILRQLVLDKQSLVDVVNTNKIKLLVETKRTNFERVRPPARTIDDEGRPVVVLAPWDIEMTVGTVDALSGRVPVPERVKLTLPQFAQHAIGRIKGEPVTVKMIIKLGANWRGGRHYDPVRSDPELKVFASTDPASRKPEPRVMELELANLPPIGAAVLRALEPLIEDVLARHPHLEPGYRNFGSLGDANGKMPPDLT